MQLNANAQTFAYNVGTYTVHQITGTNLYLIYVDNWSLTNVYPYNCPDNSVCSSVRSPGCIEDNWGACISIVADVCVTQDTPTVQTIDYCAANDLDKDIRYILEERSQSDFCACEFSGYCTISPTMSPTDEIVPTSYPTTASPTAETASPTTYDPTTDPTVVPTVDPTPAPSSSLSTVL